MVEAVEVTTPRTRDSELWFDDGTIVIVAQSVEFRVYKGQLARRFDVFKDLDTFPQSTVNFEHGSGFPCPVLHVTDSARDWRNLLRMLFCFDEEQRYILFPLQSLGLSMMTNLWVVYAVRSSESDPTLPLN